LAAWVRTVVRRLRCWLGTAIPGSPHPLPEVRVSGPPSARGEAILCVTGTLGVGNPVPKKIVYTNQNESYISSVMSKIQFGISLTPELGEWAKNNAQDFGFPNRNAMIEELLWALREGRLVIRPPGPDAFPAESVEAGKRLNPLQFAFPESFDE
jgi:hypothetical protein